MINDYDIKNIDGEDVLLLSIDLSFEFGSLKDKLKTISIKDNIKKYIKDNNIKFNGKKILFLVSGVIVGTLILNKPVNEFYDEISIDNQSEVEEILKIDESPIEHKEIVVEEPIIKNDKVITSKNVKNKVNNTNVKKEEKKVNNSNIKKEVKKEDQVEIKQEEVKENKNLITIKRNNGKLLELDFEEYIIGVVAAEVPAEFNIEALKAQAVVARTYALKTLERGKVLTDDSSTQNYKDNDYLKKLWGNSYDKYYSKIKKAVNDTKGYYLTYNGEIIDAVYHSISNGLTEDASNVWGNSFPYLVSVVSEYDYLSSGYKKDVFITYKELSNKLDMDINSNTSFNILSRTSGDRIKEIEINDKVFSGVEVRNLLGLRSADFVIEKQNDGIKFTTTGYGHGVGMSQYGANGMAKNGYTFDKILLHYYVGCKLVK